MDHDAHSIMAVPEKDKIAIKVLGCGFVNTLHRTAREEQLILSLQPNVNTQHPSSNN